MIKTASLILLLGLAAAAVASQAVGVQADMVGQGFSYRILSRGGFGVEIVARGVMDLAENTSSFGGELRLLKYFNMDKRVRFFAGAAVGAWQIQDNYWHWLDDSTSEELPYTRQGISSAALFGIDIVCVKIGEHSGLSVAPEVQFGYYSMPGYLYGQRYVVEGEDYSPPEPLRFISPGVGIGLKYFW